MPKSSPRIIAVAVSFCLVLSQMGGLAQSNPVPRFAQNEFSAALFCHEAVPAPLEWMQRSQGVGYALRRMAAATLTVLLAGSAAAAAQLAGRAPAGVEDQSLRGRPPTMTFEKALILARKQGGLDIQPEHKKWVEGLFGNFQFWMESSIGHDTMKAWKNRPGDWGVLSFVENLKIQSDMVSTKVEYRLDAEFIDLLEDPQVQVLRHEKPDFVYVLIPETPKSSGGLFRVSGVFKDDEPQFLVVPLAIINGSVPVASITLKSLLLPVLLLVSQTLHAAPWGSEGVNPYRPMKEFWYMLLSGEILVRAQPHVDIDPIWGWGSMTVILLAAAMLVIRRFHPQFDRKTSPSEPWTFARGVRQVLVVTLFVLLSGTTLKAFGPNDALDSPAALGSFMFLSAA